MEELKNVPRLKPLKDPRIKSWGGLLLDPPNQDYEEMNLRFLISWIN
jgi:hypothetical protein